MKNLSETKEQQNRPYIPKAIREAKSSFEKAKHFYQMGYLLEECEKYGVSPPDFSFFEEKYKGASIPFADLLDLRPRLRPADPAEGKSIVGPGGMTYDEWKGNAGPGARLRKICAEVAKEHKSRSPGM